MMKILKLEKLPFKGKNLKNKKRKDDRGRWLILDLLKKQNMKTLVGISKWIVLLERALKSACLTFTEEKSLYTICFKLDHHNSEGLIKQLKKVFLNKLYIK
ncbi:hypothetical protein MNU24_07980 [Spiroplasma poulsonii]|uniref:hypothetical protein n=1 Tax=Spiroplasma poulsonii TaxID=2138 RepID=UPI001F4CBC14|nr:hypothetical protein [Spiroplasma poulsonii]UNF61841.1 hypothetical protein MNU24_07980 [Spiroplasma poulsonii]